MQEEKWYSHGIICSRCDYGWVVTHPDAKSLECPNCHKMNKVRKNYEKESNEEGQRTKRKEIKHV